MKKTDTAEAICEASNDDNKNGDDNCIDWGQDDKNDDDNNINEVQLMDDNFIEWGHDVNKNDGDN